MSRLAPLLLALLVFVPAPARADDWTGRDKALHFSASLAVGAAGFTTSAVAWEDGAAWQHAAIAMGATTGVGLGKELVDLAWGKPFSGKDLVWDLAGGLVATAASWLIYSLVGN